MNFKDIIQQEFSLRYPDSAPLKPALVDFIEACMQRVEAEGVLVNKVRDMRTWQKKYFRSRDKQSLEKSKELEGEIDRLVAPPKPAMRQGGLF